MSVKSISSIKKTSVESVSSEDRETETVSINGPAVAKDSEIYETLIVDGTNEVYNAKITILNKALQDIGMGKFQWILCGVAGFGWFMDSFWMLAISLISIPIKRGFNVHKIAYLSLFKYIGLTLGATFWPLMSDLFGRSFAFNTTLIMSGASGLVAAGMPDFASLNFFIFLIGFATGGNQPVDSMLFVELIPASHQHLLLHESAFWGVGNLVASGIGWPLIVNFTCEVGHCTYENNMGWRYSYWAFGGLTLLFSLLRMVARIYESPKYYVGKHEDRKAVDVIQAIAKRNKTVSWLTYEHFEKIDREFAAKGLSLEGPIVEGTEGDVNKVIVNRYLDNFKHWKILFQTRKMAITTILLWCIWGFTGMAFPLFNNFLPFYLEWKGAQTGSTSLNKTYRNYCIQAVFSIPPGFFAGWLSNRKYIGRKGVGFLGGVLSGIFMYLFTTTKSSHAYLIYNCCVSFVTTFIYAAMYAYTPEVYPAQVRGAATSACSFWNRFCGTMGPVMALYLNINNGQPVFISGALFIVAGVLFILLPYETRGRAAS